MQPGEEVEAIKPCHGLGLAGTVSRANVPLPCQVAMSLRQEVVKRGFLLSACYILIVLSRKLVFFEEEHLMQNFCLEVWGI